MDIAGVNASWRKPGLSTINQTVFKKLLAQKNCTFFNFSLLALKLESLTSTLCIHSNQTLIVQETMVNCLHV